MNNQPIPSMGGASEDKEDRPIINAAERRSKKSMPLEVELVLSGEF